MDYRRRKPSNASFTMDDLMMDAVGSHQQSKRTYNSRNYVDKEFGRSTTPMIHRIRIHAKQRSKSTRHQTAPANDYQNDIHRSERAVARASSTSRPSNHGVSDVRLHGQTTTVTDESEPLTNIHDVNNNNNNEDELHNSHMNNISTTMSSNSEFAYGNPYAMPADRRLHNNNNNHHRNGLTDNNIGQPGSDCDYRQATNTPTDDSLCPHLSNDQLANALLPSGLGSVTGEMEDSRFGPNLEYNLDAGDLNYGLMSHTYQTAQKAFLPTPSSCELQYDPKPLVIKKRSNDEPQVYRQNIIIRYFKPPRLPEPGPIIIREIRSPQPTAAPPLIIRQRMPKPLTPPPLILRERPPVPPKDVLPQVILKRLPSLPPHPRQVIIERYPPLPPKPRDIIIERWLPYESCAKRKVIYQRASLDSIPAPPPKNVVITYDAKKPVIKRKVNHLGVVQMEPEIYLQLHGSTVLDTSLLLEKARVIGIKSSLGIDRNVSSHYAYYDESWLSEMYLNDSIDIENPNQNSSSAIELSSANNALFAADFKTNNSNNNNSSSGSTTTSQPVTERNVDYAAPHHLVVNSLEDTTNLQHYHHHVDHTANSECSEPAGSSTDFTVHRLHNGMDVGQVAPHCRAGNGCPASQAQKLNTACNVGGASDKTKDTLAAEQKCKIRYEFYSNSNDLCQYIPSSQMETLEGQIELSHQDQQTMNGVRQCSASCCMKPDDAENNNNNKTCTLSGNHGMPGMIEDYHDGRFGEDLCSIESKLSGS